MVRTPKCGYFHTLQECCKVIHASCVDFPGVKKTVNDSSNSDDLWKTRRRANKTTTVELMNEFILMVWSYRCPVDGQMLIANPTPSFLPGLPSHIGSPQHNRLGIYSPQHSRLGDSNCVWWHNHYDLLGEEWSKLLQHHQFFLHLKAGQVHRLGWAGDGWFQNLCEQVAS